MSVEATIRQLVEDSLQPIALQIENESHMHSGPATESHFKLTVVSEQFEGKRAVQRHQQLYGLCGELLKGQVHALALHLYTPTEWQARQGSIPESPRCMGGSKADQ